MNYELMVITRMDAVDPFLSKLEKTLKEAGASDIKLDKLGRKQLSYPVAKQTEGEFFLFNFKGEGSSLGGLYEMLALEQEAVLRYLIIKVPQVSPSFAKATEGRQLPKVPQVPKEKETKKTGKVIVKTRVVVRKQSKVVKGIKSSKVKKVKKGKK